MAALVRAVAVVMVLTPDRLFSAGRSRSVI
jgi:hypothetical protein